jgi:hypothetical protein
MQRRDASQALDLGVQAVARSVATLSQQEKNNSADLQRNKESMAECICTEAR